MVSACLMALSVLGGGFVVWMKGEIGKGDSRLADLVAVLKDKLEEDKKSIEGKMDHKHRNVDTQFESVRTALERLADRTENLTKDNVLLNERLRTQENQVREFKAEVKDFKTEMKDSFQGLRTSIDTHLKEISATQNTQFEQIANSIREIRKVEPK